MANYPQNININISSDTKSLSFPELILWKYINVIPKIRLPKYLERLPPGEILYHTPGEILCTQLISIIPMTDKIFVFRIGWFSKSLFESICIIF